MTVSPLRVLKKFSGPLGYVPDEDTDVVEGGKAAKKFLNFLLSKLQTTVTVLTTTDCRHQMFFTTRKQWFVAEEFFVPENGSLYVDAVLANIFLDNLTEFIGDTGHVKKVLASQPEKLNILADHIATVLQPFLQPDSTGNLALVKTIWAFYRPICEEAIELQIEERDVIMDLRPAWDYVAVPEQQQAVTVRLFDSGDFRWPSKFVKLPISSSSINSSPYIPMHIKHFLSAFSSRLGQNFSIERQESPARTEYSHRHREQIVLSIYNWNWIAACSLYLQLSDNPDERRRELHLFEADLAIQMYTSLVEKTFCPADLVKKLELVEKSTVTVIAEAVVRFLEKHRDFEFKFEAKAWESREWKKLAEQFWKEGEAEERNNNQMETETSFDRIPADSELLVKQEPSLSPPESMSENDEDSQKSEPIEEELCNLTTSFYQEQNKHEFDILSMEDSIECRLSMTEVESDGFRGLESHRQFLNLILAKLGAELVLKADTRSSFDEDKITIEIRKDDDLMYQADLRTYVPERLLEQGIQSLVKSFEQRMLISPADAKSLQSGGEATKEMIAAIVEECDGSRM